MIDKETIQNIKEITELQKEELLELISADMPIQLKKVSQGLNIKEMKFFRDKGILNLKEKMVDGKKTALGNDDVIFDVIVPLLELRGVTEDDLNDIEGAYYLTFYRKVEALTNNPKIKKEVEKKN